MSCFCNNNRNSGDLLARHINRYVGETVTIFTTSGGASGCGFTGTVIAINNEFVRLVTHQGTPPSNPLAENICGDFDDMPGNGFNDNSYGNGNHGCHHNDHNNGFRVGSVCDIPIDRIAAFCHNAV